MVGLADADFVFQKKLSYLFALIDRIYIYDITNNFSHLFQNDYRILEYLLFFSIEKKLEEFNQIYAYYTHKTDLLLKECDL